MQTTKYWAPWVRTAEACWPAWNAARLSVMLATRAAAMAGSTIEAVDAHEPEQAHGAVDHSEADVAIGSGEQGLEHLDDTLGKAEAKSSAEDVMSKTQKTVMQTEKR